MGSKKKDLEIIYSLQWNDKPTNGGDKANIIGMYDIPATTLNWEIFKSYLLKNSGAVGEDVKVSYITDSNREFPIDSQTDFQIALYAFRRKARMCDIVNLKLRRASGQEPVKVSRNSNDVETQFDNEAFSLASTCCNADTPPEWFLLYMNQFKKEIKDDINNTVSGILSNHKPHAPPQQSYYLSRKSKVDNTKRLRKLQPHVAESSYDTKDLIKSLKIEGKLERKLEKLEHKTKKIREKKIALFAKSSDSEAGQSSSNRSHTRKAEVGDDILKMDATPVVTQNVVPHMLGGEVYLHRWKVLNTGRLAWTSETTLNFTWGSKALKPLETVISVPHLQPNEMDTLSVRLEIPDLPGQYECYWHFHHNGRRFGHWLGCQVIVDPFDLKGNKSVLESSFLFQQSIDKGHLADYAVTQYADNVKGMLPHRQDQYEMSKNEPLENNLQSPPDHEIKSLVRNISRQIDDIKLQDPTDTNCSSDSDNQSVVSLTDVACSKGLPDEFVMVPIPDCFKVDNISMKATPTYHSSMSSVADPIESKETIQPVNLPAALDLNCDNNNNNGETNQNRQVAVPSDDIASNYSQRSDVVLVSFNDVAEMGDEEYAYVLVEGQKSPVPVPKKIIKSEYLENTDKTPRTQEGSLSRTSSSGSSVEIVNKADLTTDFGSSHQNEPVLLCPHEVKPIQTFLVQPQPESLVSLEEPIQENVELPSHCSVAGTCFSEDCGSMQRNSRVFVFPEDCPGYELLAASTMSNVSNVTEEQRQPSNVTELQQPQQCIQDPSTTTVRSTHPLNLTTHDRNPFSDHLSYIPNYQQTLPEHRQAPEYVPIYPNAETFEPALAPGTESFVSATEFNAENFAPPPETVHTSTPRASSTSNERRQENVVHILPETLVTGAVNVASSAINTARSVINMIRPQEKPPSNDVLQPGTWVNGRWVSANQETLREANLHALAEMGFWNRDLNATLLARFNDDLSRVVAELVQ